MVKVRETLRVSDANTQVLEWYETRGGKETKAMEIHYSRKHADVIKPTPANSRRDG